MRKSKIIRTLALFPIIVAFIVLVGETALAQTQVNIPAGRDNTLYENNNGALSNGAGEYFFVGRTGSGERRRGLLFFDIAGNIPAGATINSVTLRLNMSRTISGSLLVGLHRASADWGEGTSNAVGEEGSGANSTTGDATWRHRFFNTSFWTNPGGDFVAMASAEQSISAIGFYTWGSTPEMVNDVQSWLDNPSNNFGWLLLGVEGSPSTAKRFDSRQNPNAASRPQLTVNYTGTVAVKDNSSGQPAAFALHENFPNPFTASTLNSATVIRYELPRSEKVSLAIYNLLGEKIRTLVNAPESAGSKQVIWNGANDDGVKVASGIYIYRIEAGTFTATRKLTFIKN
ncbi:DNRLRE domain-containing protein [candidate division KSB1 bacterium]|nr:DNRLRE domain-containing protein [candidate division KSB1 bacterium]